MKPAGVKLATIAFAAAVVTGSATMGLAHGGGGGGGGDHGGFGGGNFGGMPFVMHGGGFGGSHMTYGNHFDGYSHDHFYHGDGYHPYFPYFPSYDDDDDSGYDYYSSYCARIHRYTGTYIGSDGRLHYCS